MTAISVVICTRNRPELIGQAVGSVLACDHPDFELLVVDQSSDDATERALAKYRSDVHLRYMHVLRAGLAPARNLGLQQTAAPIIAFTDDDCTVPPDWLQSIERAFETNPDVDLMYGDTHRAPDMAEDLGVIPALAIARQEKLGKGYGFRIYGMGADFALRRRLLERVEGFDEALGAGGPLKAAEDFDFQFRTYRAGAVTLLCPDVWVDHYGLRRGSEWADTLKSYGIGDGAFYVKHVRCGDLLALKLLTVALMKGALRELLIPIRPRPSFKIYWRAFLTGMRNSMRFEIDKRTRLYKLGENAPA
ncbi:MAG TPA: glycosyltransferase family A protein [Dehalococcoidia bacterium]|nr:glycosyltransferase family A protein [Dehalococcoidia bacterium]